MTQVRETSLETYILIRDNGLLSQRRWDVYEYIFHHGPVTGQQIWRGLGLQPNQSGRLTEMRDMGILCEVRHGVCPVTGYKAIFWDVTSNLPVDYDKPKTPLEKSREDLYRVRRLLRQAYEILDGTENHEFLCAAAEELGIDRPLTQGFLF